MMPVAQVIDWLESLPWNSSVGVDEGGLTLREVTSEGKLSRNELEIGGIPEEIE